MNAPYLADDGGFAECALFDPSDTGLRGIASSRFHTDVRRTVFSPAGAKSILMLLRFSATSI